MDLKTLMQKKGNDTLAGVVVLVNYLDDALHDLENGDTENYDFIYSVIVGLYVLSGGGAMGRNAAKDYLDRFLENVPETWIEEK